MPRAPRPAVLVAAASLLAAACSTKDSAPGAAERPPERPPEEPATMSKIKHLVVVIQENHSFDSYFGRWCKAPPGSNPTCTSGPACCEAVPDKEPGAGAEPRKLDDTEHAAFDPNHFAACEIDEMNDGRMDRYVTSKVESCGNPRNFAVAGEPEMKRYWGYAGTYTLADRYFQPVAGASYSNDIYFARASFGFIDNALIPTGVGNNCLFLPPKPGELTEQTIADLLVAQKVPWAFYAEGYGEMLEAQKGGKKRCPPAPDDCKLGFALSPCVYEAGDNPFQFYPKFRDNPLYMRDYGALRGDLAAGRLPSVTYVKFLGYKNEHPGASTVISAGVAAVGGLVDQILASKYSSDTLIALVYDESGGYFDHVAPPPKSAVDGQQYGPRVPFLAIGPFARKGYVSHVTMEHSSLVRFIEWNWLGGKTGQLGTRDAVVNNIGSVLDPATTGVAVPES